MNAALQVEGPNGPTETPAPLAGNLALFAFLFLMLAAAMTGYLGGGRYPVRTSEAEQGPITIAAPKTLRTGEFFEMRLSLAAKERIAEPTLVIGTGVFRNTTVNSFYPAADKEWSTADEYLFEYGPLAAGERYSIKIDAQINENMTGTLKGPVALYDGDDEIARVDLFIKVLP